jgi:hypothetical protein
VTLPRWAVFLVGDTRTAWLARADEITGRVAAAGREIWVFWTVVGFFELVGAASTADVNASRSADPRASAKAL